MASSYVAESRLESTADFQDLALATALGATPAGLVENPQFFSGMVTSPTVVAAGILSVADVAATRYYDPSWTSAILDPVVTASGDRLRFESFSGCNGVYARFDLLADGLETAEKMSFGTTNVDINAPLRTALTGIGRNELMQLGVGNDALTVSTLEKTLVERKVNLPDRWIRGMAHSPWLISSLEEKGEVKGPAVAQFLGALPRSLPGPTSYWKATPRGIVKATPSTPGAVRLAGTSRLNGARRLARVVQSVKIYGAEDGTSGWVFTMPGARFTLVITPDPHRGFSGEGANLRDLSQDSSHGTDLLEYLAWEPQIDETWLSFETGLSASEVRAGLASLASMGKVGFDLAEQSFFHRELPIDTDRALRDNPRLAKARKLVEGGKVSASGGHIVVAVGEHPQYVRPEIPSCTCQWYARYGASRGFCSHLLAAELWTKKEAVND